MDFQNWILAEDIEITVTSGRAEDDDDREQHMELLVARVFGPGAVLLALESDGDIYSNGQYVDFGDDGPAYWGIFDHVKKALDVEHPGWHNPLGFACEMPGRTDESVSFRLSNTIRAAAAALLAPVFNDSMRDLGSDSVWSSDWTDKILVYEDGTWCSPGTFDSTNGTWAMQDRMLVVVINPDNDNEI
jgi:hypothetical protein